MTHTRILIALTFFSSLATPMFGAVIDPASYDLTNGQTGAFSYLDGTYAPSDMNEIPLAELSGGKGELTDGFAPDTPWRETPGPYVGWLTLDPSLKFHFDDPIELNTVRIFMSDTGGNGGVVAATRVVISDGDSTVSVPVSNNSGNSVFTVTVDELNLSGNAFDIEVLRGEGWLMLSEVEFDGEVIPEPSTSLLALIALAMFGMRRRS